MRYRYRTYTVELVCEEGWDLGQPLRSGEDIWHFAPTIYQPLDADKEHFVVIILNNKNRYVGHKVISTGTLTASLVHPREVLTAVLNPDWRAAAVVFVHNHPSGDPQPSGEDQDITRRHREIFELLGIRLLDHVILGQERFFSFADRGLL
jgi:DNA repair protein RadC